MIRQGHSVTIRSRLHRLERRRLGANVAGPANGWVRPGWVPPGPPIVWTDETRLEGILAILRRHGGPDEFTTEGVIAEAGSLGYPASASGALQMLRDSHQGFGREEQCL